MATTADEAIAAAKLKVKTKLAKQLGNRCRTMGWDDDHPDTFMLFYRPWANPDYLEVHVCVPPELNEDVDVPANVTFNVFVNEADVGVVTEVARGGLATTFDHEPGVVGNLDYNGAIDVAVQAVDALEQLLGKDPV